MTETDQAAERPRVHVGLTGGIAAGKSAVARVLQERGALLVDSDALARLVLEKGTDGLAAVRDEFGDRVITADGELDRVEMARIVFGDERARQRLNRIVHPRIRAAARRIVAEAGPDAVVVQDVPLLVETGQADAFDLVVVVEAPLEERLRRMVEDRGMSRADAEARIAAQATDEQRRAVADVVIVNDADLERLASVANQVWDRFLAPDAAEPSAD
ncbi:dephospho-CoA kinase [Micrococcus luteus]|uniref:dephospho-CoA kinase n=1 Tax=Micrococcus luteus TaxID=1270 RepID=UPI002A52D9E8|nr:dephospho-CoA kinase [Micrococcus luteus]MCV7519487.1 dephospho-CoA kinase [Micrococcus luteus]MCV7571684.1 dephospho-CoA kinase [Micrococcus luteus]MCV7623852.1 dephospho-CoA kinase [Micrococcus luteus]